MSLDLYLTHDTPSKALAQEEEEQQQQQPQQMPMQMQREETHLMCSSSLSPFVVSFARAELVTVFLFLFNYILFLC